MMIIDDVVIERQVDACAPCPRPINELSLSGVPAEYIDDMILIGRLYVGSTVAEHEDICAHIQADRMARRLIQRLMARAA